MPTLKQVALLGMLVALGATRSEAQGRRLGVAAAFGSVTFASDVADLGAKAIPRTGGGLVLEIPLTGALALVAQPSYLGKGAEVPPERLGIDLGDLEGLPVETTVRLSYVEIPVQLKIAWPRGSLHPYALGGPSLGILTRAKERARVTVGPQFLDESIDIKDKTRSFDFGIGVGGGLGLDLGRFRVFVEGQYVFGLVDVVKSDLENVKNRGFLLRTGITIPLGHQ